MSKKSKSQALISAIFSVVCSLCALANTSTAQTWIPGAASTRRYDLVVQNPGSGLIFGVEVKTSLSNLFKLNPQQVAFDVRAIQSGAQTALGVTVNSIMYRGVGFGSGPAAAWNTLRLAGALKAAGVPFHTTKSPLP